MTGISNALGGHENEIIRDSVFQKEIEEIIVEVFESESMGYCSENQSDSDLFSSSDESASDHDTPLHSDDESDSICSLDFEPLS